MNPSNPTSPSPTKKEITLSEIERILTSGASLATHSWEYATATSALLELYNPQLSVFGADPFPNRSLPDIPDSSAVRGLSYAERFISTTAATPCDGEGSSGDAVSLGVACAMLGKRSDAHRAAAERAVQYLFNHVPCWPNGAISHREASTELWADFVYMAPPFLAYQAVACGGDVALLRVAMEQCFSYSRVLSRQFGAGRLWSHIARLNGSPREGDEEFWATGNGWAAAGSVRVLAIALKWPFEGMLGVDDRGRIERLAILVRDIIAGAMSAEMNGQPPLLCNYLDDKSYFGDVAGTALIAAAAFRLAVLAPEICGKEYTDFAERCWGVVQVVVASMEDGHVGPTPQIPEWRSLEPDMVGSSEGHCFVVLAFASWRDWIEWKKRIS